MYCSCCRDDRNGINKESIPLGTDSKRSFQLGELSNDVMSFWKIIWRNAESLRGTGTTKSTFDRSSEKSKTHKGTRRLDEHIKYASTFEALSAQKPFRRENQLRLELVRTMVATNVAVGLMWMMSHIQGSNAWWLMHSTTGE